MTIPVPLRENVNALRAIVRNAGTSNFRPAQRNVLVTINELRSLVELTSSISLTVRAALDHVGHVVAAAKDDGVQLEMARADAFHAIDRLEMEMASAPPSKRAKDLGIAWE
jgi:hypothetical protein